VSGFRAKATHVAPIDLSTDTLKNMHAAIQSQIPFAVKTKRPVCWARARPMSFASSRLQKG
jgi:hypothetical protein